jgi:hypothetical protein
MDENEVAELTASSVTNEITPSQGAVAASPPVAPEACPTCGGGTASPSFVYAIGRIEARFPNLAAEKEFAQAAGERILPGKPTNRLSILFCPSARTATWCANCVGC